MVRRCRWRRWSMRPLVYRRLKSNCKKLIFVYKKTKKKTVIRKENSHSILHLSSTNALKTTQKLCKVSFDLAPEGTSELLVRAKCTSALSSVFSYCPLRLGFFSTRETRRVSCPSIFPLCSPVLLSVVSFQRVSSRPVFASVRVLFVVFLPPRLLLVLKIKINK